MRTRPKHSLGFSYAARLLPAGLIAATGALLVLASCRPAQKPEGASARRDVPAEIAAHEGEIVGNAACQPCHDTECRAFAVTAHANTLRLLDASAPRVLRPPEGRIGKTPFVIRREGDRYWVEYPPNSSGGVQLGETQQVEQLPIQIVFSAGKKGILFATDVNGDELAYFRYGYLPKERRWFNAPGIVDLPANEPVGFHGDVHPNCVDCHALVTAQDRLLPSRDRLGLGCESCHGPGGAHVIAMRRRQWSEPHIDALRPADAVHVMRACQKCHDGEYNEQEATDPRFRADLIAHKVDLSMAVSKCYQASRAKMSCLTCHSAHTDASVKAAFYERICLSCHSPSPPAGGLAKERIVAGKPCPVNPKTGCIPCHMPPHKPKDATLRTETPILLTNHRIAIYAGVKTQSERPRKLSGLRGN